MLAPAHGPLQAVAQGRWVLVEDINLAPAEVLAALVPLLERRTLAIAARAESVAAAPGFQLIATVTSAPGGTLQCTPSLGRRRGASACSSVGCCIRADLNCEWVGSEQSARQEAALGERFAAIPSRSESACLWLPPAHPSRLPGHLHARLHARLPG